MRVVAAFEYRKATVSANTERLGHWTVRLVRCQVQVVHINVRPCIKDRNYDDEAGLTSVQDCPDFAGGGV